MVEAPDLGRVVLSVAVFLILGGSACVAIAAATKVPRAPLITVATFTAHVVASAAVYAWLGLFANDAIGYDQTAVEIARRAGGDASATVQTSSGKEGWVWTLGYIYHWFGHQPILGLILNAALAAAVVPVVGLACDRLGWTFAASRAMWIVGFAPPLFIWSSFLLREPAINLTASVAFAACTLYLSTRRYRWLMLAAAADLLLVWLRGPVAVILLVGLILGVVLVGHLGASRIHPARAIAVVAVAVVAVPLALKLLGTFNASLANINQSRVALARSATTSFGTVSSSSTILGSAWLSIKQLPLAALGPFPWQWSGGFGGLLTAADALTWLAFSWFGIRAWRSQVVRRGRWMCVAPAGVLLLSIALISGNYGTLVRIRAMALPLLASLIAVGMALPRTSRKRVADIQPSVANSPRPAGLRQ